VTAPVLTSRPPVGDRIGTMDIATGAVPEEALVDTAVDVLRLLADRTRLSILALLAAGEEWTVNAIAGTLDRPATGVSQHLAKLRAGGLVNTRRDGTSIHYSIANEHVSALVGQVLLHGEHLTYRIPPHHR
jgi:DNA-binding transcriptional ArsR family regulator